MPTTSRLSVRPTIEPSNEASPKAKTPPSAAAIQYPGPLGVLAAMPTIGQH